MTMSIKRPNYINKIGNFQKEDAAPCRIKVRHRPSQTVILQLHQLESMFLDLQICSLTVGQLEVDQADYRDN